MKKNENWLFSGKNLFFFLESFFVYCLLYCRYLCYVFLGYVLLRFKGCRVSIYNSLDNLGYIWSLYSK